MAKDIGSYFLEQGQPIVPKAKPKQYTIAKEKSQLARPTFSALHNRLADMRAAGSGAERQLWVC